MSDLAEADPSGSAAAAEPATPSLLRERSGSHRVTNIELFFDLVYVFAVTQLSDYLLGHATVPGEQRQRRGLRLIGYAFAALAVYLLVQSTVVLAAGYHPGHSRTGIIWTAVTAAVMFTLAAGKARIGRALDNPVLRTEGRVTMIDGILASAVLLGLVLNAALGWWWADPAAGYVLVYYAVREVRKIFGIPSASQLRGSGDLFSPAHSAHALGHGRVGQQPQRLLRLVARVKTRPDLFVVGVEFGHG